MATSGFQVSFEIFGEKQVLRKLAGFEANAELLTESPALIEELRNIFFKAEREQFGSEGAYGSGGWAPLKPATLRAKLAKGHDPRILHRTNRLLRSLLAPGNDAVESIDGDSIFFGTKVPYAIYHQTGAPRANVTKRKPVDLTESDRRKLVRAIQKALVPQRRESLGL